MHATMENNCVEDIVIAHPILQALFTFLQMHFLFVNSQVLLLKIMALVNLNGLNIFFSTNVGYFFISDLEMTHQIKQWSSTFFTRRTP